MAHVPRVRDTVVKVPVGPVTGSLYVEDGAIESLLVSQGHRRLPGGGWSGGGPFYQVLEEVRHNGRRSFPPLKIWPVDEPVSYACAVTGVPTRINRVSVASYMSSWHALQSSLWSYVPKGYRMSRPGNPIASLGQFIIELRDLPKLPFQGRTSYKRAFTQGFSLTQLIRYMRDYCSDMRHVGGEYLNIVFGWKPFITDLRKVYDLWKTVDKRMADIVRNNGKGIRRKVTVLEERSATCESAHVPYCGTYVNGMPSYLNYNKGPAGSDWSSTTSTYTKVWYAAKYRYYIPDVTSSEWTRKARLALFGALPTPELIWAVTPWSWLIDWSVNVSDVLSNMSANAVENLVQDYSFTMQMKESKVEANCHTWWGNSNNSGWFGAGSASFNSFQRTVTKTRDWGGSPYALNAVSGEPLTAYQGGVLAALGLSLVK